MVFASDPVGAPRGIAGFPVGLGAASLGGWTLGEESHAHRKRTLCLRAKSALRRNADRSRRLRDRGASMGTRCSLRGGVPAGVPSGHGTRGAAPRAALSRVQGICEGRPAPLAGVRRPGPPGCETVSMVFVPPQSGVRGSAWILGGSGSAGLEGLALIYFGIIRVIL